MSTERPVVLLTGASAGLELALARRLLAENAFRLVLTARAESLNRFAPAGIEASDNVWVRRLDVTNAAERRAVVAEICQRWGGVDILINNAAVAYRTVIEHIDDETWELVMTTNCSAPMELARLVLPAMRSRRRGRIINVSSVGGMMAMPTMSLYSASKFALEGATESLWYEVRPWDIHVSLVQPGFIHSDSFKNTRYTAESRRQMEDPHAPYHAHYFFMADFIARQMQWARATPERVADVVLDTIWRRRPRLRIAATWDARLFALLRRFFPRRFYHAVLFRCLPHVDSWGKR
ncbi:MAG: SDR family NAD(P)-dependent oxidoreductase [Verrucomicrobiales bacterium]